METSAHIVFFLTLLLSAQMTLLASSSSVHADSEFVSGLIGQTVTLPCYYNRSDFIWVAWYKQMLGKKLHLISQMFRYQKTVMKNPRYSVKSQNQKYHLNILNLQDSDSATYHCTICFAASIDFLNVVTVDVKGSGLTIQTSVDQSSSENIHAGDSVTLNCTVHTGSCDEEHRVYWFKDSEDSHPGLIYTHGGRNDQCERKNNTQTHSCVYELHMKNLTESHAGIYYCAVVSCGHILFGNGTKLDLTVPVNSVILNTLVGLLTVMSVLVAFLLFLLWKIHKSNNCTSTEERSPAAPLRRSEAENKDTESLHYAAVNVKKVKKSNRSRRQKNDSNTVCLYASVRQQN
uniref:Ig-like domain-containing protein n=1 Tax=Oryzias sinensis TaxID=183150 RepID=A0A8C7WYH7_9TELE